MKDTVWALTAFPLDEMKELPTDLPTPLLIFVTTVIKGGSKLITKVAT